MIYIAILISLIIGVIINIYNNYENEKFSKYFFIFIGIIIFFIAGLRDGIGYDFYAYKNIFNMIKHNSGLNLGFEPGYVILNMISPNFSTLIFIVAIIGVALKLIAINRYSEEKLLSLLMYFAGIYIMYDMGVIRQGMSMSMAFISIKYIANRDFKKFIGTILIGSLFHVSILLFIPLYFLSDKIYDRKLIYGITTIILIFTLIDTKNIIINIFSSINIPIISSKILYYANMDTGNITLSLIKRIVFLVIFVEFYENKNIKDKYPRIFLNGYIMSIIIMGLFSSIDILGGRGVMGLYSLQIMIFATICRRIETKRNKFILLIIISILSYNSMIGPIKHGSISNQPYTPYKSILNKKIEME